MWLRQVAASLAALHLYWKAERSVMVTTLKTTWFWGQRATVADSKKADSVDCVGHDACETGDCRAV